MDIETHVNYLKNLNQPDELQYWLSAHLRLNGIYWALTALHILDSPQTLDSEEILKFTLSCYDPQSGGFAAHPGYDVHMLYTLSALQILVLLNQLDKLPNRQLTINYIKQLQQPCGGFAGDKYLEVDARFVYNATQSLLILNALDEVDWTSTIEWLQKCQNFDGGFGFAPSMESHGAMAFTVVGALKILGKLDVINCEKAAWWLSDRQTNDGGLNGRPEKLPDVCYSWWVLSALAMLNKVDWIDGAKLSEFILSAQDPVKGGIADRKDNEVDVFHTVFGLAGLSLLKYGELKEIDPVLCLPVGLVSHK